MESALNVSLKATGKVTLLGRTGMAVLAAAINVALGEEVGSDVGAGKVILLGRAGMAVLGAAINVALGEEVGSDAGVADAGKVILLGRVGMAVLGAAINVTLGEEVGSDVGVSDGSAKSPTSKYMTFSNKKSSPKPTCIRSSVPLSSTITTSYLPTGEDDIERMDKGRLLVRISKFQF